MIRVEALKRNYKTPHNIYEVLKGIDLTVEEHEFIAIMGKSGSGKTTLLKILGLIDRPSEGKVYLKGKNRYTIGKEQLAGIRRNDIGFVYQDYYLMNSLTVRENIMLPMILEHVDATKALERVDELAELVDIKPLLDKRVFELSGGEKQRIAICRALSNNPDIIIADEPTGNLDTRTSETIMSYFSMMNRDYGKTIILVTHDAYVASSCKRVIFLKDGMLDSEIKSEGDKEEFFNSIVERQKSILR